MDIFFDRQPVARLDDVLVLYHPHEFESPTRSAIPLLSLLKYERQSGKASSGARIQWIMKSKCSWSSQ
jgi:hypothetical protein